MMGSRPNTRIRPRKNPWAVLYLGERGLVYGEKIRANSFFVYFFPDIVSIRQLQAP